MRELPNFDEGLLDFLTGVTYPGVRKRLNDSRSSAKPSSSGAYRFTVFTWYHDNITFNVVVEGIDPGEAGDFVAALSAVQQGAPIPATSTPSAELQGRPPQISMPEDREVKFGDRGDAWRGPDTFMPFGAVSDRRDDDIRARRSVVAGGLSTRTATARVQNEKPTEWCRRHERSERRLQQHPVATGGNLLELDHDAGGATECPWRVSFSEVLRPRTLLVGW